MATAETVELGAPHAPKEESLKAFDAVHIDIKKALQHLRHESNSKYDSKQSLRSLVYPAKIPTFNSYG